MPRRKLLSQILYKLQAEYCY